MCGRDVFRASFGIASALRPVGPDQEYVAFIWMGGDVGTRVSVWASSVDAATEKVVEQYGDGHVIVLYSEAEVHRPHRLIDLYNDADVYD